MTSIRLQVLSGEASKGSAVILSLITILCCGIIFVGLVWVPFVIKSSKSYLQVVVDELCLRLYQELPFTANFNGFTWEVPADNSAFATALSRVLTMINFGDNPVAFVGVVPSQANQQNPMFNATLQVTNLVFFAAWAQFRDGNRPVWEIQLREGVPRNLPQLQQHLQALHPTRSENSVVICFSQGALNRAAWMLPFVQQNQDLTVSAISGLFQNISNINSPPLIDFTQLATIFAVNTYPSPLVLFELDENNQNAQDNFRVCFQQADTVTCQNQGGPQQFNVRRVAKKLTAIHLINLLARNGATRHSTRVGVVRLIDQNNQQVVERSIFKDFSVDSFVFSFTLNSATNFPDFPEPLCNYYNDRKTSTENLFLRAESNPFGFATVYCVDFSRQNRVDIDVLDTIYLSELLPRDDPFRDWGAFVPADQLALSPHIIWIGTNPATLEIFLRTVFVPATGAGDDRPIVTAILFPVANVDIDMLGAILANLNLIAWDPDNQRIQGLTLRSPFFNIFVFDGCGYIDVPDRVPNPNQPIPNYWDCLNNNVARLDAGDFQTFLQAFAEGNAELAFPQGIPVAPYVQKGEIPGNTIAERLAIFIYRQFLISRGWLF